MFRAWSAVEQLPLFFPFIASVRPVQDGWHWLLVAPRGHTLGSTVRVAESREASRVVWVSDPRGPFRFRVTALFEPAPVDRGTELTVELESSTYSALGALFDRLMRAALGEGVRRFKQFVEAGEVASVAGQPTGAAPETRRPEPRPLPSPGGGHDEVDVASAASFPASDPPAPRQVR